MSSPLMTRPNTVIFSFKSGIGAVVMKSSKKELSGLTLEVPSINASCFGLEIRKPAQNYAREIRCYSTVTTHIIRLPLTII